MKLSSTLLRLGAQFVFERPVRNLSLAELINQLDQSNQQMIEHLNTCKDTIGNRVQLCHMIGIERWGQRRLKVAFGEPFLAEEYDHYRPSSERSWEELISEWKITRQTSIEMMQELAEGNPIKIDHNQYGPLSVKAWLRYLDVHASSEGRKMK